MEKFDRELAHTTAELLREKRIALSSLESPAGRGWAPLQDAMADVLCKPTPGIGVVIEKLATIQTIVDIGWPHSTRCI